MWHVWGRGAVRTGFWWGKLKGKDHLEDPDGDGKIMLKIHLKGIGLVGEWTGFIWLRIETSGGLL